MDDDTDRALLQAWAAGDRAAGDALLRRHFDALWRFFRNKVEGAADDLIQRTFVACLEGRHTFRGDASFRAWLFVVARNKLYRHFRERARIPPHDDIGSCSVAELGDTPSRIVAAREEQRLLLRALRRIPLDLQIAIELHYWEGLSTHELGEVLGVPQGTAKSRLRRARTLLDEQMRELAEDPQTLASTLASFQRWAEGIRDLLGPTAS